MEHVTREVNQLPGIGEVTFAARTKEVTIAFDPAQVSAEDLRRAVQRANAAMATSEEATGQSADLLFPSDTGNQGDRGVTP